MLNKIEVRLVSHSPLPPALHGFRLSDRMTDRTNTHSVIDSDASRMTN